MRKPLVYLSAALLLAAAVSASSFGTFSSEGEKKIDSLETRYSIGMFNPGPAPLDVRISSEVTQGDPEDISLVHPTRMRLESSPPTRDPAGEGPWFLLGRDRYVKVEKLPVKVFVDRKRATDSFRFRVTMKARPEDSSAVFDGQVSQTVVQERSYSYSLEVDSPRIPDSSGSGASGSQLQQPAKVFGETVSKARRFLTETISNFAGSGSSPQRQDSGGDSRGSSGSASFDDPGETGTRSGSEKATGAGEPGATATGDFIQAPGADPVTLVLMLFMAMSTLYLVRVMDIV